MMHWPDGGFSKEGRLLEPLFCPVNINILMVVYTLGCERRTLLGLKFQQYRNQQGVIEETKGKRVC
jgi:hypothetical protein